MLVSYTNLTNYDVDENLKHRHLTHRLKAETSRRLKKYHLTPS